VPGVLGSLQALEALKFLLGIKGLGADELLLFDLVTLSTQRLRARRAAGCRAHAQGGARSAGSSPASSSDALDVDFALLEDAVRAGYSLIDVRDANELIAEPLPVKGAQHLPMSKLLTGASLLELDGQYLLVCATGKRSAAAADLLRSQGLRGCRSLRGGLKGLQSAA
jgi:rhodanese-related sulfurtransferase